MRILHVISSLDERTGGPLRTTIDLAASAAQFGFQSEIVGIGPVKVMDNALGNEHVHSLPLTSEPYRYSNELRPWLRANARRFDGVIIHGAWLYPIWAAAEVCGDQQLPYLVFPHGLFDYWPVRGQGPLKTLKKLVYWHLREKKIVSNANCILYTTKREQVNSEKALNIRCPKQIIVPYGLPHRHARAEQPANEKLALSDKLRIGLFLSRLHPKKNLAFLMRAWAKAALPPNWRLVLAGEGDPAYKQSLVELAESLKIREQVIFAGHVAGKDKAYLFQRADWFLLPSLQENFGVAVFEALSYGCPVAISDEVYLAEFLHAESEILPLDEHRWVEFLRTRMTDDVWRDRLRELDRQKLCRYFDGKILTEDWVNSIKLAFSNG